MSERSNTAKPARNQVGLRMDGVLPGSADEGPGVPVGGKPTEQTQTADCPRCHAQCGWCSDYRWMHRTISLHPGTKQRCGVGDFEPEGSECPMCRGSRKVRMTIIYEAVSVA